MLPDTLAELVRLALAALACYRLSRLIAWEEGPGNAFGALRSSMGAGSEGIDPETGQPATLLGRLAGCPYCWGIWLAWALSFLFWYPSALGDNLLLVFGIAGAQAYMQGTSE